MGEGGGRRDALCNAASAYWVERCLLTTVFQTSSIIILLIQACWVFLFSWPFFSLSSLILNGPDQDLTIHFWFQLAKLNLPAPPLLPLSLWKTVMCGRWASSTRWRQRANREEPLWWKCGTKVALKFISLHCLDLLQNRTCLIPFQHGYCAAVGWQQWSCVPFLPLIFMVTVAYPDSSQKVWSTHLCKNCF